MLAVVIIQVAAAGFVHAQPAPTPPSLPAGGGKSPAVCGKLTKSGEIPLLELWGTPELAGYAHGYLLAEKISTLFDDYILDPKILPQPAIYEAFIPQIRRVFIWPDAVMTELGAMERGAHDRLGEQFRSQKLDRELTLDDLLVANAMADLLHVGCSTFSVWGRLTGDGQTITGRNLDFPYTAPMAKAQIVMARHGASADDGWVGVTWPGLVGVYTAMNSRGVTIALHDAPGLPLSDALGFTPRSITLRMALERAAPATFAGDIQSILCANRVRVGNNIHASAPCGKGHPTAAVYEYDGNPRDKGVQMRLPAEDELTAGCLCCTNHMRLRKPPSACRRYERLEAVISGLRERSEKLDIAAAFQLLKDVRQSQTLHSVVFEPARRHMHVLIPAVQESAIDVNVGEWLDRKP